MRDRLLFLSWYTRTLRYSISAAAS